MGIERYLPTGEAGVNLIMMKNIIISCGKCYERDKELLGWIKVCVF